MSRWLTFPLAGPSVLASATPNASRLTRGYGGGRGLALVVTRGYAITSSSAAPVEKSDRAALDAIAVLLRATGAFDKVIVSGKSFEATPLPAKWGRLAHLELRDDPSSAPDQSPLMIDNRGRYRLTVALRQGKDDKPAADEVDRVKRVVWNALMADGAKDYGGFCHPWRSTLQPVGRARPKDIGLLLLFDGKFFYSVDMSDAGYSESR